jgi:hypothetical protein
MARRAGVGELKSYLHDFDSRLEAGESLESAALAAEEFGRSYHSNRFNPATLLWLPLAWIASVMPSILYFANIIDLKTKEEMESGKYWLRQLKKFRWLEKLSDVFRSARGLPVLPRDDQS